MASHIVGSASSLLNAAAAPNTPTPSVDEDIANFESFRYPIMVWFCVAGFILFLPSCRVPGIIYRLTRKSSPLCASRPRGTINYWRLPVAASHAFRALAFRWTFSIGKSYTFNVTECFVTAAYIATLFSWSFINSTSTEGVRLDPQYWANTAGRIAVSQLPLVVIVGMKNNIISFLTGISINKLNYFHRVAARIICGLIWVHAGARLALGATLALHLPWIQFALLGITSLTILSVVSIRPVRRWSYRIFLIIHFQLVSLFLLGAYFHTQQKNMSYYVWPSVLLWSIDRVVRLIRLFVFNFVCYKLDAQIDVLSSDFLRITLQRPGHTHWAPGQFAYLTVPGLSFLGSHPFTISSIDVPHLDNHYSSQLDLKQLKFLVRVHKRLTRCLRSAARDGEPIKVLFDGPYGESPLVTGFETVILIAGGSGVSFTLPLLLDLVRRANKGENVGCNVIFVWAIRDTCQVEWISDTLVPVLYGLPPSVAVEIRLFVTGANSRDDDDVEKMREPCDKSVLKVLNSPLVHVRRGRPDLRAIITERISSAGGDISVNVCGPEALANSVRTALCEPRPLDILRGGPDVSLHIESFSF